MFIPTELKTEHVFQLTSEDPRKFYLPLEDRHLMIEYVLVSKSDKGIEGNRFSI